MGKIVPDKIYYMSEKLGIPKSWVPPILGVSDTTLTKWSYNPGNVSTETSERIFLRVAILEQMAPSFEPLKVSVNGAAGKKMWMVTVNDGIYLVSGSSRLPSEPPKEMVHLLRNAIVHEEHQHPLYLKHRYRRFGDLSKIAHDKSLEMPLGVIRWEGNEL